MQYFSHFRLSQTSIYPRCSQAYFKLFQYFDLLS
nr:MAG TPA: hypothetical protein [Caudoviricetes sp.]